MSVTRRHAIRRYLAWAASLSVARAQDDPLLEPVCVMDFAPLAKAKLDPVAWDYLDGGGEDEATLRENRTAFDRIILRPRALVDVHKIDLTVQLLGLKLDYPIFLSPAGGKNCFYPGGEVAVTQGAAAKKALHISNGGILPKLASDRGPAWWHLTTGGEFGSKEAMRKYVQRIEGQGFSGICFSVDIMYASHRDRNARNKFQRSWCETGLPARDAQGRLPRPQNPERVGVYPSRGSPTPTWETVRELRAATKLPIILKGIMTGEDAALSVENGVSAVFVSNHGARQLDHVGSTIEALPEIAAAVKGRVPILIDGGFRRGTDILKALALGANAVGIARPYLYGLAAFGQPGVERVIELLRTELALDMALAGVPSLSQINRNLVRIR